MADISTKSPFRAALEKSIDPRQMAFDRNKRWAAQRPEGYFTKLDPETEAAFQLWLKEKSVPFDDSPMGDYDMRGFYQAQQAGDPAATTGINANDQQLHFTDKFKTPYHKSFSRESQYALPDAPTWNDLDQLVDSEGNIIFDERKK